MTWKKPTQVSKSNAGGIWSSQHDLLDIEHGAYYLLDRGDLDFQRLFVIHQANAFFVTRTKSNIKFKRRYSNPVDRATSNIVCDQTGVLTILYSSQHYPATLYRVVVKDDAGKRITFLTNNFTLKPELIANLYRQRWQIDLFFKWSSSTRESKRFMAPTRKRSRRKSGSRSAHTC